MHRTVEASYSLPDRTDRYSRCLQELLRQAFASALLWSIRSTETASGREWNGPSIPACLPRVDSVGRLLDF